MPFLQTEYISAAFCFLFMFICLSVPPLLFFRTLKQNAFATGLVNFHKWDNTLVSILFVWYFTSQRLLDVFLPDSKLSPFGFDMLIAITAVLILHSTFGFCLFIKGGYFKTFWSGNAAKLTEKNQRIRNSRLIKIGNPIPVWPIYIAIILFIMLCFNSEISKLFLYLTVIYWLVASYLPGIEMKDIWPKSDLLLRCVIVMALILFFILYIRIFSLNQFGKISQSVGGGKPENAYFNIPAKNLDVVKSIGIPKYSPQDSTNLMFGPISILLRTDSEILFISTNNSTTTNINAATVTQIRSDLVGGITFLKSKK